MNTNKIIESLEAEREALDQAICAMYILREHQDGKRKRGRPPKRETEIRQALHADQPTNGAAVGQ